MNIIRLQGPAEKKAGIYYEYDMDSKPLGEGGMGRVFKGFRVNEKTGERIPVAIKAIYENIPERVVERARREAEIQIDHDNLIRMYGFVENKAKGSDKVYYHVIMELLIGVTLEDMLKGATEDKHGMHIPFASELRNQYISNRTVAVTRIMKALLSGLMALHDRGIIHRDIDPSNIMITFDGKIKLIDFGICKQIVTLGSQDKGLTASGVFMGKVNYAAPELVLGDVRSQSYTTDIYAVGIMLYQLVTGHLPFVGTDQDILASNLRKAIPMGDVKRNDVKKIIRKATDKSQSKRYQSVAEMRVDIEHINPNVKSGVNYKLIGIAASALLIIGIAIAAIISNIGNDNSKQEDVVAETQSEIHLPNSEELMSNALSYMAMSSIDSVNRAAKIMLTLATDSAYSPAMFEYGITYAHPTKAFPELAIRQQRMEIKPDIDKSNQWLNKVLDENPTDYKAAYWIYNNLMTKVEDETITPAEYKQLASTFKLFKQLVSSSSDSEAIRYKEAMESADDENTLKAWAIIN